MIAFHRLQLCFVLGSLRNKTNDKDSSAATTTTTTATTAAAAAAAAAAAWNLCDLALKRPAARPWHVLPPKLRVSPEQSEVGNPSRQKYPKLAP